MTKSDTYRQAEQLFRNSLKTNNKRCTPERIKILRCAMSAHGHFDVGGLYATLEKDSYHVSLATVYNTVELLCGCGLLRRYRFADGIAKYEFVKNNHTHLICTVCGKVREVKSGDEPLRSYRGFKPQYAALYVYGVCSACSRREEKERKEKGEKQKYHHNQS